MIRSHHEFYSSLRIIESAVKSGNTDAVTDLIPQFRDLIDTLHQDPDMLSSRKNQARIVQLENENRYLQDQIRILTGTHNTTQNTMRKMGEDLDKFNKIFTFMMEQKEAKRDAKKYDSEAEESDIHDIGYGQYP